MNPFNNIYNAVYNKLADKKYKQHLIELLDKQQEETRIYQEILNDKTISPDTYAYINNKHMLSVMKENHLMKELIKFK